MGNKPSSSKESPEKEFENFYDVIDYIATYYILTMDFKSLSKLSEKEYCDKLIILTADILKEHLNEKHISYLEQRVKDGVEVNTINNEKFVFIDHDVFDGLDIAHDTKVGIKKNTKKQRVCIGIAKFYVKIAHIFAAILMTINPVYSYTDTASKLTMNIRLSEKEKIPKGTKTEIHKLNICDNRISALRNKELIDEESGKATLQPNICDVNMSETGMDKTLADEPGIPELMQLYFDKYDDKTGTFTGMSEETAALFQNDLKKFYTAFTGNDVMPPEITRFSEIKLRDYNKQPNCMGPDPKFRSSVKINVKDDLFTAYADNMRQMIQTAADNQIKLLEVINDLFTYTTDLKTQKKVIRVNPKLTEETLKVAVEKTRKYIMELYLKCETDYEHGVKIYEAILESKNAEILPRQIDSLNDESTKMIQGISPGVVVAEKETEFEERGPEERGSGETEFEERGPEERGSGETESEERGSGETESEERGFEERPDYERERGFEERPDYERERGFEERPDYDRERGFEETEFEERGSEERPDYARERGFEERPDYERERGFEERPDYDRERIPEYDRERGSEERPDYDRERGFEEMTQERNPEMRPERNPPMIQKSETIQINAPLRQRPYGGKKKRTRKNRRK